MTINARAGSRILGSLQSADGTGVVRMEDRFDTGIDDLWSALTEPRRLARWLGEFDGDLCLGGGFRARFHASGWEGAGRVEACEPPRRLLVTTKGTGEPYDEVIEAVLTADGDQTILVLEQRGMPLNQLGAYGAGIQVHIEDLAAHIAGQERCDAGARWHELQPAYEDLAAKARPGKEPGLMADDTYQPVAVSRRIRASAHDIFQILADPCRHPELDGSQSLREAGTTAIISGVGDVFVMKMHFSHFGDYEMNNHVVEYEPDRRISWEPEAGRGHPATSPDSPVPARWGHRWSYQLTPDGPDTTIVTEIYDCSRAPADERARMDNGNIWAESMAETLERLDALCTRQGNQPRPS
jgi:uncharacterized protein YndB with AHSA1/START domain